MLQSVLPTNIRIVHYILLVFLVFPIFLAACTGQPPAGQEQQSLDQQQQSTDAFTIEGLEVSPSPPDSPSPDQSPDSTQTADPDSPSPDQSPDSTQTVDPDSPSPDQSPDSTQTADPDSPSPDQSPDSTQTVDPDSPDGGGSIDKYITGRTTTDGEQVTEEMCEPILGEKCSCPNGNFTQCSTCLGGLCKGSIAMRDAELQSAGETATDRDQWHECTGDVPCCLTCGIPGQAPEQTPEPDATPEATNTPDTTTGTGQAAANTPTTPAAETPETEEDTPVTEEDTPVTVYLPRFFKIAGDWVLGGSFAYALDNKTVFFSRGVAGATVQVENLDKPEQQFPLITTSQNGMFTVTVERNYRYKITVLKDGHKTATATWHPRSKYYAFQIPIPPGEGSMPPITIDETFSIKKNIFIESTPDPKTKTLFGELDARDSASIQDWLDSLVIWLYSIAGVVATLMTVMQGLRISTAGGNATERKNAIAKLQRTLVALIFIFGSFLMYNVVVSNLFF